MNSKKLRETHLWVYQQFFGKQNIVVSCPFLMKWCDNVLPDYSGISIKQKIPLRMYVWAKKNNVKQIKFENIMYWDHHTKGFTITTLQEYAPYFKGIEDYMNTKYADIWEREWGYDINILSEISRWRWLWFDAIISLLLSSIANRVAWTVKMQEIEEGITGDINKIMHTNEWIKLLLLDAYDIDTVIHGKAFSSTKISALFTSAYPIVCFTEKEKQITASTKRFWYRLQELFTEKKETVYTPIDYGIIYSGKPFFLEQVLHKKETNIQVYEEIQKTLQQKFAPQCEAIEETKRPRFYTDILKATTTKIMSRTYSDMMWMISIQVLYCMIQLFTQWYTDHNMKLFLKSLDKIRYGNYMIRESSEVSVSFINKFFWSIKADRNNIACFPNNTSVMWWSFNFAVPSEGYRKIISDAVSEVNTYFEWAEIIYANWIDGIEHEGIKYEQDTANDMYADCIKWARYKVKYTDGWMFFGSYEECIKKIDKGIVLDTVHNKMYINWRKLTSSDLHSQAATVDILISLIENIGKEIDNKSLPLSWYAKNKNEMIGKIIVPLVDLIQKECKERLPLFCRGSIYDFSMRLQHSNIWIALVQKI